MNSQYGQEGKRRGKREQWNWLTVFRKDTWQLSPELGCLFPMHLRSSKESPKLRPGQGFLLALT